MRIFLSWSGELSRRVAAALDDWLPSVIQSVGTFVSQSDIESGSRWAEVLFRELDTLSFGIACLTKQNATAPWINFESGALAKRVTSAKVVPFLFEMRESDLPARHPFTQFQYVAYRQGQDNRATMFKLLKDINQANDTQLNDAQLTRSFESFWPRLETKLTELAQQAPTLLGHAGQEEKVDVEAVLEELLDLTRGLDRRLSGTLPQPGSVMLSPRNVEIITTNIERIRQVSNDSSFR